MRLTLCSVNTVEPPPHPPPNRFSVSSRSCISNISPPPCPHKFYTPSRTGGLFTFPVRYHKLCITHGMSLTRYQKDLPSSADMSKELHVARIMGFLPFMWRLCVSKRLWWELLSCLYFVHRSQLDPPYQQRGYQLTEISMTRHTLHGFL
jgi:hypothetical protein